MLECQCDLTCHRNLSGAVVGAEIGPARKRRRIRRPGEREADRLVRDVVAGVVVERQQSSRHPDASDYPASCRRRPHRPTRGATRDRQASHPCWLSD